MVLVALVSLFYLTILPHNHLLSPHPSCLIPFPTPEAYIHNPQVRKGLIYRCAEPSKITEAGKEKLRSLGVKKMYDLRSEPELKRLGDLTKIVEVEGVERLFVPVIRKEDYSPQYDSSAWIPGGVVGIRRLGGQE